MQTGAGEDVEAVMARLAAQGAENAALKERQSKLDKDQQVSVLQPSCATSSRTCSLQQGRCQCGLHGCAASGRSCVNALCLVVPPVAAQVLPLGCASHGRKCASHGRTCASNGRTCATVF